MVVELEGPDNGNVVCVTAEYLDATAPCPHWATKDDAVITPNRLQALTLVDLLRVTLASIKRFDEAIAPTPQSQPDGARTAQKRGVSYLQPAGRRRAWYRPNSMPTKTPNDSSSHAFIRNLHSGRLPNGACVLEFCEANIGEPVRRQALSVR